MGLSSRGIFDPTSSVNETFILGTLLQDLRKNTQQCFTVNMQTFS